MLAVKIIERKRFIYRNLERFLLRFFQPSPYDKSILTSSNLSVTLFFISSLYLISFVSNCCFIFSLNSVDKFSCSSPLRSNCSAKLKIS